MTEFSTCQKHKGTIRNLYCGNCYLFFCYNCRGVHKTCDTTKIEVSDYVVVKGEDTILTKSLASQIKPIQEYSSFKHSGNNDALLLKVTQIHESFATRCRLRHTAIGKIRIGSWNLHKVQTIDVAEINSMCKTISHYKLDIIALQEINIEAAKELKKNLNDGRRDLEWHISGISKTEMILCAGIFLWKTSSGIRSEKQEKLFCETSYWNPYLGKFSVDTWNFSLLNFHLPYRGKKKKENDEEVMNLATIARKTTEEEGGEVILIGDFNSIPKHSTLDRAGFVNIFGLGEYTNTIKDETYDNIIVPHTVEPRCADHGVGDIILPRQRRNSTGSTCSLPTKRDVSDHLPIWADFFY